MAEFKIAYDKTAEFEGGYVNHPNDRGGETYKGIARNFWGKWEGWKTIDRYKTAPMSAKQLDKVLAGSDELQEWVEVFYRTNFWNPIKGDHIDDQDVANNIYDFAVNSGVNRAARYAQRVAGVEEDGMIGNVSIGAINSCNNFVAKYKAARLSFFQKIVANDPSQKVFLRGWTNRVENA